MWEEQHVQKMDYISVSQTIFMVAHPLLKHYLIEMGINCEMDSTFKLLLYLTVDCVRYLNHTLLAVYAQNT